jgi:glycosyltransferase involved in cell wall biosynthesis
MGWRIGIDFHDIDGKYQGSRTHIIEIFSRIIRMAPEIDFYLFCAHPESLHLISNDFLHPNVHPVCVKAYNAIDRLMFQLPKMQMKYSIDIMHTQYFIPIPSLSPAIVSIHDILFETHPQYFGRRFKTFSRFLIRWSALRSCHVITGSQYCKAALIQRYRVQPERITVIHNAADSIRFYPGSDGVGTVQECGLSSKRYILTVGRLEPRKNHHNLLNAYARLVSTCGDIPTLVIVGPHDPFYQHLYREVERLGLCDRVVFLSNIDDSQLPAIFRHAKLFVYPSWAEGFGIPVLEAMQSGVPVICSNTTAFPEVAGKAASLVDPADVQQISTAMAAILSNSDIQTKMTEAGLLRSSEFSWSMAAESVLGVYRAILSN